MEKELCHCLEIFDKLGSSATASWGKNAPPSSTCEVPEMGWKRMEKSQGESTVEGKNNHKRKFQC